jgi:xanthine dehydrogenase accessory factor
MALTDAIFDGSAFLAEFKAILVNVEDIEMNFRREERIIPITVDEFEGVLEKMHPTILVDARMRKHIQPERQLGLAPFSIGLGPNFNAGVTTDIAIETSWENLGRMVRKGTTLPLKGEPAPIGVFGRDRYVYAPCSGIFETISSPGDSVIQGEEIAKIGDSALSAPITGVIRGITRGMITVKKGTKVIEIDPRGEKAQYIGIGKRPQKIARGVLAAVKEWEQRYDG